MQNKPISAQAHEFIRLLKAGILSKEILPNTSDDYTGSHERSDTQFYVDFFLRSSIYDMIEKNEEVSYCGE